MIKGNWLNLDGYIPQYSSEEARITEYLRELNNIVPPGLYHEIYGYFMQTDKKDLADYVIRLFKKEIQQAEKLKQREKEIIQLRNEQENRNKYISNLEEELNNLRCRGIGIDPAKGSQIKQLYEKGWSLRKIGEYCGCDKSTIKRILIKMGVSIRK